MSLAKFVCLVSLSGVSVALALGIVALSAVNERSQGRVQAQQMAINNGVLGPQGRQISGAILQDMAAVSVTNVDMGGLLRKYGYTVQTDAGTPPSATAGAIDRVPGTNASEVTHE